MHQKTLLLTMILVLALALAACGDDENKTENTSTATDPTPTAEVLLPESTDAPTLDTGLDITEPNTDGNDSGEGDGLGSMLPGCGDVESDECPVPLDPSVITLDGEASSSGMTIAYPSRYFDAVTSEEGVLITISPSERNKFALKGTFEVYFAESADAALADFADLSIEPDTAAWSTDTLTGTISVVSDETLDPPITTAIGAFTLVDTPDDDRIVVLKATTTGQFGWYFHSKLYEAMLDSLVIAAE